MCMVQDRADTLYQNLLTEQLKENMNCMVTQTQEVGYM